MRLDLNCLSRSPIELDFVTPFQGKYHVLSNFYPCKLLIYEHNFKSVEHAYQYRKCMSTNRFRLADDIKFEIEEASDVKRSTRGVPSTQWWSSHKVEIMEDVLNVKLSNVPEYRQALLAAKPMIAEAVRGDLFWSTGLSMQHVLHVRQEKWPGFNMMGKLHMKMRNQLRSHLASFFFLKPAPLCLLVVPC